MTFKAGAISTDMKVNLDPMKSGFAQAPALAGQAASAVNNRLSGIKIPTLHGLKQQFGRRSEFGEFTELLAGGGVVMGLTLAGRVMTEATAKAKEFAEALREGDKSAGDLGDDAARSIPILGGVYAAGRNIREVFTGAEAEGKEAIETATMISEAWGAVRTNVAAFGGELAKVNSIQAEARKRVALLGLTGPAREAREASMHFEEAGIEITKVAKETLKGANEELEKKVTEARQLIEKLQAKMPRDTSTSVGIMDAAAGGGIEPNDNGPRRAEILGQIAELEKTITGLKKTQADNAAKMGDAAQRALAASREELGASLRGALVSGASEFWEKFKEGAQKALDVAKENRDAIEEMKHELAEVDMTGPQKAAEQFSRRMGVTAEQIKEVKSLAGQIDAKEKTRSMTEEAKQFLEAVRTPAEKATEVMRGLQSLFESGQINAGQLAAGLDKAKTEGMKTDAAKRREEHPLALVRANSADALRLAFGTERQAPDQVEVNQLSTQRQMLITLRDIKDRTQVRTRVSL